MNMTRSQAIQKRHIERAEAFVRDALSAKAKRPPSKQLIRSVAKKVSKAIPQRVLENA
jgi:hypothetical protein